MMLFTATVKVSSICSAKFSVTYQDLHLNCVNFTLSRLQCSKDSTPVSMRIGLRICENEGNMCEYCAR